MKIAMTGAAASVARRQRLIRKPHSVRPGPSAASPAAKRLMTGACNNAAWILRRTGVAFMSGLGWLSVKCALKRSLLAGGALLGLVTTGGSQALASAGCDAVNAGAFNVHFTQPNSVSMNITGFVIGIKSHSI